MKKPAYVIIGGYNSLWPTYLSMARELERISGLQAIGVPLLPWDWWVAEKHKDATNVLHKVRQTVNWARRRLKTSEFILVGHSAGGVIARLYTCDHRVWTHLYAGADHVVGLITLGSPHCGALGTETGWYLTDEANRLIPGAAYASQIEYRVFAGRYIRGDPQGSREERRAYRAYHFFTRDGRSWGDGAVPLQCAGLPGVKLQVLDRVAHSRKHDHRWYGSPRAVVQLWSTDEPSRECR